MLSEMTDVVKLSNRNVDEVVEKLEFPYNFDENKR